MKIPNKEINYKDGILTFVVFALLTAFCRIVDLSLIIPILLFFLGLHLFFFNKADVHLFIRLGLLLVMLLFGTHAVLVYTDLLPLTIPVAGVAMLTMLLFNDLQLAFLMSLASSVLVGLFMGGDLNFMLIFFMGSLTASFSVRHARTRGQIIGAGVYVSMIQSICAALLYMDLHPIFSGTFLFEIMRPLVVSGFLSAFLAMAALKIFEYLFGVITNYSLLELSDFNQPLLKNMILEAPGTYHHSIVVSNMAEAAADAIDANALLTRVGAYYHDVGKMEKPEYFTENQSAGGNKHDNIEPSISRLVILNHVKEGVELAKKHKLNPLIRDFIMQHHGTSLMHYFYRRALEDAEDESSVKEENYRYPGPKPQTKEAAIVLLADSVEAATRSVDEPNPQKIEEVVRKVINNKFIDGQLDECNLTLKEIETIALIFTRILGAMYHSRVRYPEKKDASDHRGPKQAEDGPAGNPPD